MKQRSPVAVFFLPFLTLGIYGLVWYVKTAGEMRWKWCEGVAKVTNNQFSAVASFLVLLFLGPIGMAIVQSHLNRVQ